MTRKKVEKYDPARDHDPLIPMSEVAATPRDENAGKRPRRPRAKAWTACPDCANKKVPLEESSSGCLLYREHSKTTFSGAAMQCRASGSQLCVNPSPATPKDSKGRAAFCAHEQEVAR